MNRSALLLYMRENLYAVQASTGPVGPQAAIVGVVITDDFEIFFDTLSTTRKAVNLRQHQNIALVFGNVAGTDGRTVQVDGVADEPTGAELARLKRLYLERFPDGVERERLADITYFRVRPTWLRYSDFRPETPVILEWGTDELRRLL